VTELARRWLDPEAAAAYLSVRVDALPRLVKQGRIPAPDHRLGARSPRWDRLALDAAFEGGTASTDPRQAVDALAQKIAKGWTGRKNRQADAV
jgi:hypothetical protein